MGKPKTQYSGRKKVFFRPRGKFRRHAGSQAGPAPYCFSIPKRLPQDASAYEGIRLLVRVNNGNLSISANSSEITNYDFHANPVTRRSDGKFHEVEIPFAKMRRAWSEQTPLNTKTLTSLSLVAFDVQEGSFHFEVDEVSFY